MASKRPKFGANFAPKAQIDSKPETTKNIAFGNLNAAEKEQLKERLASNTNIKPVQSIEQDADIKEFLPEEYTIKTLSIDKLEAAPDTWNFFAKPSKEKLAQLAESIYTNGLLQPIVVRAIDSKENKYQILAGHTRVEAYKILYDIFKDVKYLSINAMVFGFSIIDDDKAQDIICDTNFMQRGNLPIRDMAKCIYLKAKRYKQTRHKGEESVPDRIAREYKMNRSYVFLWQRIAKLTDDMQRVVENRRISVSNAYKLSSLKPEEQAKLIESCEYLINNDSLKSVKNSDDLETIINKINDSYGAQPKILRYEISLDEIRGGKDVPILVFVDPEKKDQAIADINKYTDGAYVVRS